jgi:hypothetical protein
MTKTANHILDLCLAYVTCVQILCTHSSDLSGLQVVLISLQHSDFIYKIVSVLHSSFGHNGLLVTLLFSSIFVNIFRL